MSVETERQETGITKRQLSALEILTNKITEKQDGIFAILPSHTNPERFIKSALLVISGSQKLQKCSPQSVIKTIYQAAELGLDFTPAKRLAYMVPFNNDKNGTKVMEATFMPGYKGLEQLATNAKAAKRFSTQLVYDKEIFEVIQGSSPSIVHKPILTGGRGNLIGGYTVSWQEDGSFSFTFVRKDELEKIRESSKAKNSPAWQNWPEEMYKKTVIRRHCKTLQLSPDKESELFARAIEADNEAVGLRDEEKVNDGKTQTERLRDIICDADYEDIPEDKSPELEPDPEPEQKKRGKKKEEEPEPAQQKAEDGLFASTYGG